MQQDIRIATVQFEAPRRIAPVQHAQLCRKNRRAIARSRDGGITFEPATLDEALIEPVCQASLIRHGKALLFSNPAGTRRENMTVRISRDGGKTWDLVKALHPGPADYSNLISLKGGHIGLLYERGEKSSYETITFARWR